MPLIGDLTLFQSGVDALASEVNANFAAIRSAFNASAVLRDVSMTIPARHDYTAGLDVSAGGITVGGGGTITGPLALRANPDDYLLTGRAVGDPAHRIALTRVGGIQFGGGTVAPDTHLDRESSTWLRVTNVAAGAATSGGLRAYTLESGLGGLKTSGAHRMERTSGHSSSLAMIEGVGPGGSMLYYRQALNGAQEWGNGTDPRDVLQTRPSPGVLQYRTETGAVARIDAQARGLDRGNSGAAIEIDWRQGSVQRIRLTANCLVTFVGAVEFGQYELILVQDGSGGRTVSLTGWDFGDFPLDLAAGANAVTVTAAVRMGSKYFAGSGHKGATVS